MTVDLQPSASERARTVVSHATTMVVEVGPDLVETIDVTGVDTDGSLVLLIGTDTALADRVAEHAAPCRLHAALVSPLPAAHRVLDRVTAVGHLWLEEDVGAGMEVVMAARTGRPAPTLPSGHGAVLLRMTVTALNLDGCPVSPADYAAAEPDPLAAGSDAFVEHLHRGHAAQVVELAHLLDAGLMRDVHRVTPVRVDRFGLTMAVDGGEGSTRVRLNFPTALRDPQELPRAMHALQLKASQVDTCPFTSRPRNSAPPA